MKTFLDLLQMRKDSNPVVWVLGFNPERAHVKAKINKIYKDCAEIQFQTDYLDINFVGSKYIVPFSLIILDL